MGNPRVLSLVALASLTFALAGCVHDSHEVGQVTRSDNPAVIKQLDYAKAHYKNPNTKLFGSLGRTDCVNFTSQTLLARGWRMTKGWSQSSTNGMQYTRAWISSTGLRDYLTEHPELATPLTWKQRSKVEVGDVVQFDWDASGDRDHTAVISGIRKDGTLLLTSHSPSAFDWPIGDAIAAQMSPLTQVYFWHIK